MPRLTAKDVVELQTLRRVYRGELATWQEKVDALVTEITNEYPHVVAGRRLLADTVLQYSVLDSLGGVEYGELVSSEKVILDIHLDTLISYTSTTFEEYAAVIAWVRLAKEQSIDRQDFQRACDMRDREKRALVVRGGRS